MFLFTANFFMTSVLPDSGRAMIRRLFGFCVFVKYAVRTVSLTMSTSGSRSFRIEYLPG